MNSKKIFTHALTKVCITIDTEGDSANNPHSTFFGIKVALPKLLNLFSKYNIKATFFIQEDEICQVGSIYSKLWKSLEHQGHEIGYHAHGLIKAPINKKEEIINRGIRKLRKLGLDPVSYRGGRFHLNGPLLKILEKNNIKYDSSVVPGLQENFNDGTERCNHFEAPRKPYFPSYENHNKEGNSRILELPINRYPNFPSSMWGGMLAGGHNNEILFDYFHEIQKDKFIIVILHTWEGISFVIRDAVRKNYGRIKKFAFESLGIIFSSNFLTNGTYLIQFDRFLRYVSEKKDVQFVTIRQAGENIVKSKIE